MIGCWNCSLLLRGSPRRDRAEDLEYVHRGHSSLASHYLQLEAKYNTRGAGFVTYQDQSSDVAHLQIIRMPRMFVTDPAAVRTLETLLQR